MSDSESEISNPDVFTFQSGNMTLSARGPNTNVTNFTFRNQLTSTMCLPRNFERQRYAESVSDQRSIYYRRETSPMSIRSACDMRPRNFQPYYNGMGSQQSLVNGRSGRCVSPMSMRSIDSSASVSSAADIAFAFKNLKFSNADLELIKRAYQQLMKKRIRKRVEKRRNMRMFMKGRRRSGEDSGDQGSDSSISADDCRSGNTFHKENVSCNQSKRMNLTNFRAPMRENNMFRNDTHNFRENGFKNLSTIIGLNKNQTLNTSSIPKQSHPVPTLKDRFKNGFLLPSQRFNRSVASSVIPENAERQKNRESNYRKNNEMNGVANMQSEHRSFESGSEEEIFSRTVKDKSVYNEPQRKRSLDSDEDTSLPDKKKSKLSSPTKNSISNKKVSSKSKSASSVNNNTEDMNNFEFVKPTLPVRKSKTKVQETVISKSKQPITGFVEPTPQIVNAKAPQSASNEDKTNDSDLQVSNQSEISQNSDVSMRPSFIKRKLFTQKLDVAEKANPNDALNSPQSNVYSSIQKEKNKTRKLVASQSCMNRDIQEDNNLLDLIHKIVPPDRINITNQSTINQTKSVVNNSNKKDDDDDDRWDVTSVISTCNINDASDTFTDEEIFGTEKKKNDVKKSKKDNDPTTDRTTKSNVNTNPIKCKKDNNPTTNHTTKSNINTNHVKITEDKPNKPKECKIVLENLCHNKEYQNIHQVPPKPILTNVNKSIAKISAKTFWDTDFESDAECHVNTQKNYAKENTYKDNTAISSKEETKQPQKVAIAAPKSPVSIKEAESSRYLNKSSNDTMMTTNTLDTTRKLNIYSLSVRSHRTAKTKKCCNETCSSEVPSTNKTISNKITHNAENNNVDTTSKAEKHDEKALKIDKGKGTHKSDKNNKSPRSKNSKSKSKVDNSSKNTSKLENNAKSKPKTESNNNTKPNADKKGKSSTKLNNPSKSKPDDKVKDKNSATKSNSPRSRSTTKSSKETKSKTDKEVKKSRQTSPNNRTLRSSRTPVKNKNTKKKADKQMKNTSIHKSPSNRPVRLCRTPSQTRGTTKVNTQMNSKNTSYSRPIRSCRTPSQNRSLEDSRLHR